MAKKTYTITRKLESFSRELYRLVTDRRFTSHPLSRIFRRIFEIKTIRQIVGFNLIGVVLATNFMFAGTTAFGFDSDTELTHLNPQLASITTETSVRIPLEEFKINQYYNAIHHGIDLQGSVGDPIYPVMKGKVESVVHASFSYGNHIVINHGSEIKSLYAHLSKVIVEVGQEVDKNTVIGTIGSTGWSTGPHLHLEIYDQGQNINPLSVLKSI